MACEPASCALVIDDSHLLLSVGGEQGADPRFLLAAELPFPGCAAALSLSGAAPGKLTAEMMEKEAAAAPEDALRPTFA